MNIKITTLVENHLGENLALESAHGISFLIEYGDTLYLFDTAQHDLVVKNAEELGYDLNKLNKVIISHNHYDHGGGLKSVISNFGPQDTIVHKDFFKEKYGVKNIKKEYLGINYDRDSLLDTGSQIQEIKDDITYIDDNIFVAANFERKTDFEKVNKRFYIKENNEMTLDYFKDEIALGIESSKGLIILLGCSHPGVVNMIRSIIKKTKNEKIYCILGGTHLVEGGEKRIYKTLNYMKDINVEYLGFSHCTGKKAEDIFEKEMPNNFFHNNTGTTIEI
jgi:7,8-dihydropterin-6-yl-methyl-4-(beta-D-ribofuranosyl)aminobenzene 5'-phosphate synthase